MAFCTDIALTSATQAANAMRSDPLPDHWGPIVPLANRRAYLTLRRVVLGRGYSATQFAAWGADSTTDGYDWNLRLGVVYAFIEASKGDEDRGAAYREELKELLEELAAMDVVISGTLASPTDGRVGYGEFDTSSDRYTLNDPAGDGSFDLGDSTKL